MAERDTEQARVEHGTDGMEELADADLALVVGGFETEYVEGMQFDRYISSF